MSSTYDLLEYRTHYFKYKDLDNIYGKPDVDYILKLLCQVTRNTQRLYTTLGGSQLGYLVLCIALETYVFHCY